MTHVLKHDWGTLVLRDVLEVVAHLFTVHLGRPRSDVPQGMRTAARPDGQLQGVARESEQNFPLRDLSIQSGSKS